MEDKIICLVGASGSGKTTIAKELEKEGYNIIHSYTTREPREENEWGHIFTSDDCWEMRHYNNDVIAEKELYDHGYFATKEQYQGKGTSIYIVCPDGARQVKENVDDAEVIIIFLQVEKKNRSRRITKRQAEELGDSTLRLLEIEEINKLNKEKEERLKKDEDIFKIIECDYAVDANRNIKKVVENVKEVINAE